LRKPPRAAIWVQPIKTEDDLARAFVCPGQGAQSIGMGKDLAEAYPAAMDIFNEVDEALGKS